MGFILYKGESGYDSSKNVISDDTAERIARVRGQNIGVKVFDVLNNL